MSFQKKKKKKRKFSMVPTFFFPENFSRPSLEKQRASNNTNRIKIKFKEKEGWGRGYSSCICLLRDSLICNSSLSSMLWLSRIWIVHRWDPTCSTGFDAHCLWKGPSSSDAMLSWKHDASFWKGCFTWVSRGRKTFILQAADFPLLPKMQMLNHKF